MAGKVNTVDDLISAVRSLLDEENNASVDNDLDILPALNRAQDVAANILARHYESPLLNYKIVSTSNNQAEYDIPEDALEERLEKIEVEINSLYYPIRRIDYRDISLYETQGSTAIPYYYAIVGNKFRLVPTSNGTYSLRVWYNKDPLPLVTAQGRITKVDTTDQFLTVDAVGTDLTTENDNLNSYINIIDGQTGARKGSFQIKSLLNNRIYIKTSPTRSSVYNIPISSNLGTLVSDRDPSSVITIEPDDLVSVVAGACIPFFKKPFSNYLIQYAVADIRRKLGEASDMDERIKQELLRIVERSWVGREQSIRVSKRNDKWDLPVRRYFGKLS